MSDKKNGQKIGQHKSLMTPAQKQIKKHLEAVLQEHGGVMPQPEPDDMEQALDQAGQIARGEIPPPPGWKPR